MSESFRKTALSEKWTEKFGFHSKGSGQRMRNEEQSTQNVYSMHVNGQDSVDLVAHRANCDKNRNSSKHWLESGESVDFLNAVEIFLGPIHTHMPKILITQTFEVGS